MSALPFQSLKSDAMPVAAVEPSERDGIFRDLLEHERLVLAVSGGSDSMALLHLAADWRADTSGGPELLVATVDHGLRPESAAEADWVAEHARARGLAHETRVWLGPKPTSGVQQAAREVRYGLLTDLAKAHGHAAIVTAHHADDQAETVLMRLMRGSGLDGLAGVPRRSNRDGVAIERPFLDLPKARLAATLKAAGRDWLEDPSNESLAFERVRVRRAMEQLTALGLTSAKIAESASRLGRARDALELTADALAAAVVHVDDAGYCDIDRVPFAAAPQEIALRVLARVLGAVGGRATPGRLRRLEALLARLRNEVEAHGTLAGCLARGIGETISVYREPGREGLPELMLAPGETRVWDGRFEVEMAASGQAPVRVAALSPETYRQLAARESGLRRLPVAAAQALPAFWRADSLIAVPQIGYEATPERGREMHAALCRSRFTNKSRVMVSGASLANGLRDPIF